MNEIIIDTSAWLEFFEGTSKGLRISEIIHSSKPLVTGMIVAEICSKFIREQKPFDLVIVALRSMAGLIPIDFELGREVANVYYHQRKRKPKFGILDAHVVAAAKLRNAKVLTCDQDFSGIPEVIIIK